MSKKSLTHKDLSQLTGVSETTIKSYRRKFIGCVPVANNGKPIRFELVAGDVCLRIKEYFELGMTIEEVRVRLAQEFSWIKASATKGESRKKKLAKAENETAQHVEFPSDFTLAISNLAKSMITLTQQQTSVLKSMQSIETRLDTLGLKDALQVVARPQQLDFALSQIGALAERMDAVINAVALLEKREHVDLPFLDKTTNGTLGHDDDDVVVLGTEYVVVPKSNDPSRSFLSIPLVVRTAQGGYVGVGGQGRGRFSLNDLKALLAYRHSPPDNYALRWEKPVAGVPGDWWLIIEQSGGQVHKLRLLLTEINSSKGLSVAEIVRFVENDVPAHPVEACRFVASLLGS